MKNLIDSLTPHKLNENEVNEMLQSLGGALKEELLTLTCEACHKSIVPNEKGDNFYDGEDGTFCMECAERAEAGFQMQMDYEQGK